MPEIKGNLSKYVIYGAGIRGQQCADRLLSAGIQPLMFIDKDPGKEGGLVSGVIVKGIEAFKEISDDTRIVISSVRLYDEIRAELIHYGIGIRFELLSYNDLDDIILRNRFFAIRRDLPEYKEFEKSKYSIIYDHQIYSLQYRGGISRYNYELIRRMTQKPGCEIDFFEGVNLNHTDFSEVITLFHRFFGRKILPEQEFPYRYETNSALMAHFVGDHIYDICHTTYYDMPIQVRYRKLVITVHDLIQEIFGIDEYIAAQKKVIINAADGIIAVSENTKKDLIRIYGVDENKIRVIYEANSLINEVKERPIQGKYILYVGNRSLYKNFAVLAKAFARINDRNEYMLIFFGGGEFTEEEKNMFEELDITDQVMFLTGDDQLLADCYAYAEIFVYPSSYEGFGLPVLEAMHYGTPVIAANNSSLPEVGGEACLYFESESADELTLQINRLLSDTDLRDDLIRLGYDREKGFSWDKCADETAEFYKDVINGC